MSDQDRISPYNIIPVLIWYADLVFLFLLREAQSLHIYATLMFLVKVLVLTSFLLTLFSLNPLTPMYDQDRISPYNINTISTRWVMRIKKNINIDPILNS